MNKQIVIELFEKSYRMNFPNVAQVLDIEANKMLLSSGKYHEMVESSTKGVALSGQALDLIDALSTFSVLAPDLKKNISYVDGEIDLKTGMVISNAYKKIYFPWFSAIQKDILTEIDKINQEINAAIKSAKSE